ncbi:trypsin-like peptidase domain-containing protein [Streptomyces sp. NPDC048442]|uniref:VMAP-C domain-containing protein n=1 Tax=Streptomyces sp. NPDC048442 TaxID=3154823 RepID=UPI00342482A5
MTESSQWLAELAAAATVHFTADIPDGPGPPRMWGSGFFVAPGLIVTCAHVLRGPLRDKRDTVFLVRGDGFHDGRPVRARMAASLWDLSDGGSIPPGLDLAVVRLETPGVRHECVWLADWAEQPVGSRRTVHGYVPEGEEGEGAGRPWVGGTRVRVHEGSPYGRRFDESEVRILPGLSGGPVLDPAAGAVVGVTKSRRPGDQSGGQSVAITALRQFGELYQEIVREHDKWHERRWSTEGDDWIGRQSALPGAGGGYGSCTWTPEDRRTALGLLAALPPPPAPYAVITLARIAFPRRRVGDPVATPVAWRDGHGELYDGSTPQRAEYFLRYLDDVQRLAASQGLGSSELVDWIEQRRGGAGAGVGVGGGVGGGVGVRESEPLSAALSPQADDGGPRRYPGPGDPKPVVILELLRLEGDGSSYDWTLRMGDADGFPVDAGHAVPAADLIHRVGAPLADLFTQVDVKERPAPLEIALDLGDFDRPVHHWQVNQQANFHERELKELLGVRRPVVVRQLERLGVPDDAWTARWDATHAAPRLVARRVPPRGGILTKGQLASFAAGEVPVLCRGARDKIGARALGEALAAGHGIALWHIEGHAGAHCRESCDVLHAFTVAELAGADSADELPDRLRRIRAAISAADQPHPAGGFALLYDDPRRPAPGDLEVYDSP